jgi:hypothetical protein
MVKPLSAETQAKLALPRGTTIPAVIDPTRSLGEILWAHAHILRRDGIASLVPSGRSTAGAIEAATLPKSAGGDTQNVLKGRSAATRRAGGNV